MEMEAVMFVQFAEIAQPESTMEQRVATAVRDSSGVAFARITRIRVGE